MVIESERLVLRNYTPDDFARVHLYGSLPDFSKYDVWGPNKEEDTEKFISDAIKKSEINPQYEFEFAVCLKEENLLIGGCGIRRETQYSQVGNLGYAINPEFQSKGYASEAAKRIVQFGFEELKLSVIYATCDVRNSASYTVMEKIGMKRVGLIKKHLKIRGHVRDSYRYEIYSTN